MYAEVVVVHDDGTRQKLEPIKEKSLDFTATDQFIYLNHNFSFSITEVEKRKEQEMFLKRLFCKHVYVAISPEFCRGQGKMCRLVKCKKCGKEITM